MVQIAKPNDQLAFPPRRDKVRGSWVPLYIEPVVGSGERITIGVAVANGGSFLVVPVPALERLSCLYGSENEALMFAAKSALDSMEGLLAKSGPEGLDSWSSPFDGIFKGSLRNGAGNSLGEIARSALMLCSSLVEKLAETEELDESRVAISESRLEKLIKERVVATRPGLEQAFGRTFQAHPRARAAKVGFVGQHIAANFSLLAPPYVSRQVKDAKAKLWDLAQVQEYLHAREFNLSSNLNRFELLVHRVRDDDPQYSDRQILQVQEAVYELEVEADKKAIRCRPLRSADEIAGIIVEAEAA